MKHAGLESFFMGFGLTQVVFIGHGVGLEINELPVITARHHTVLKEGMVFAFEPKFIFPGKGVIGMEVDFVVRKGRAREGHPRPRSTSCDAKYFPARPIQRHIADLKRFEEGTTLPRDDAVKHETHYEKRRLKEESPSKTANLKTGNDCAR